MKRNTCSQCNYPTKTCVCNHIRSIDLPIRVIVIQHAQESKHAKNTLHLAKLVAPEIEIYQSNNAMQVDAIDLKNRKVAVIYPSPQSEALESVTPSHTNKMLDTIILLDASWRQAYGMWQVNTWLHGFQQYHFASAPMASYNIRKAKKAFQLSSIEAIAYSLNTICNTPSEPFIEALAALKSNWVKYAKP